MSTDFILGIVFFCLACMVIVIRKSYYELPLSELKKRRALGEEVPGELTDVLGYGPALRALLWLLLGLTLSVSITLLTRSVSLWVSIIIIGLILYFVFSYLPSTRVSRLDNMLRKTVSPGFNWILKRFAKYLNKVYEPLEKRYKTPATPIYDNQDLLSLLKDLSRRSDHRIAPELLLSLQRSFTFDNRSVGDLMTPAKKVKKMLEGDVIGPILINDLHESAEGIAVVRENAKGEITGMLSIRDLGIRSQGTVSTHMKRELFYINHDAPSLSVIKAFYETKSNFFIVLDNNKFVGLISLDKVLKQLTGPLDTINKQDYTNPETIAKTDE